LTIEMVHRAAPVRRHTVRVHTVRKAGLPCGQKMGCFGEGWAPPDEALRSTPWGARSLTAHAPSRCSWLSAAPQGIQVSREGEEPDPRGPDGEDMTLLGLSGLRDKNGASRSARRRRLSICFPPVLVPLWQPSLPGASMHGLRADVWLSICGQASRLMARSARSTSSTRRTGGTSCLIRSTCGRSTCTSIRRGQFEWNWLHAPLQSDFRV
jgi:hypothetical protein